MVNDLLPFGPGADEPPAGRDRLRAAPRAGAGAAFPPFRVAHRRPELRFLPALPLGQGVRPALCRRLAVPAMDLPRPLRAGRADLRVLFAAVLPAHRAAHPDRPRHLERHARGGGVEQCGVRLFHLPHLPPLHLEPAGAGGRVCRLRQPLSGDAALQVPGLRVGVGGLRGPRHAAVVDVPPQGLVRADQPVGRGGAGHRGGGPHHEHPGDADLLLGSGVRRAHGVGRGELRRPRAAPAGVGRHGGHRARAGRLLPAAGAGFDLADQC